MDTQNQNDPSYEREIQRLLVGLAKSHPLIHGVYLGSGPDSNHYFFVSRPTQTQGLAEFIERNERYTKELGYGCKLHTLALTPEEEKANPNLLIPLWLRKRR